MISRWQKGKWSERGAAGLLRLKGYRIVARRLRTPCGEVDLVARKGACLVIVEVKYRARLTLAAEAILPRQQRILERCARYLVAKTGSRFGTDCVRFDVILVAPWRWPRHIVNAWRPL